MNKAQREEIYSTADRTFKDRDFIDREEFRQTFWEFAKRFEQIDPKPDPEKYQIMFKDNLVYTEWCDNHSGSVFTKEQVDEELLSRLRGYMSDVQEYRQGEYIRYKPNKKSVHEFKAVKV